MDFENHLNRRAFLSQAFGDVPSTVKYARRALGLLPEGDYITRGRVAVILGLAYWASGDLEIAHQSYVDGVVNMRIEQVYAMGNKVVENGEALWKTHFQKDPYHQQYH